MEQCPHESLYVVLFSEWIYYFLWLMDVSLCSKGCNSNCNGSLGVREVRWGKRRQKGGTAEEKQQIFHSCPRGFHSLFNYAERCPILLHYAGLFYDKSIITTWLKRNWLYHFRNAAGSDPRPGGSTDPHSLDGHRKLDLLFHEQQIFSFWRPSPHISSLRGPSLKAGSVLKAKDKNNC